MANLQLTPTQKNIYNEFDRTGLLLGLSRLPGEKNKNYKRRLLDVMTRRANSTYRGLINGITRELNLSISEVLRIKPAYSGNSTVGAMPAVVFQDTKCYVYSDYYNNVIDLTMDRYDYKDGYFTVGQVATAIEGTGLFNVSVLDSDLSNSRSMTIFNQSSIDIVSAEDISTSGGIVKLDNNNLISGTVAVNSASLNKRVSSQILLKRSGDYYIDLEHGIIYMLGQAAAGSLIRYHHRNDDFTVLASPVIIHNLQSEDFKTKMFNQIIDEDGDTINGTPTPLGANIINELISVFPNSWGV